jgi:Rhs element Vgr protein
MSETQSKATLSDLVSIKLLLNNEAASAAWQLLSVEIHVAFNKIASAKINIADGDASKQDFPLSTREEKFLPGNTIEIQMGYHDKTKTLFKGVIVKQSIKSGKNKSSFLSLEARDQFVGLTIGRKNNSFFNKTDSEIVEQILTEAGFSKKDADLAATKITHPEMLQYNVSNWDFIISRAEMNSMLVLTLNNKLSIHTPDTSIEPAKEIIYGKEVLGFECETDGRTQLEEVKSHTWNYKVQETKESVIDSIPYKENGQPEGKEFASKLKLSACDQFHTGHLKEEELKSWSQARLLKSKMARNVGYIKVKGTNAIYPGLMIKLKGFGKRFSGNVLVTAVKHTYNKTAWETDIHFGMQLQWFYEKSSVMEKPASGMVPGIHGLQIGLVVQLENDPEKEDRVKVKLPLLKGTDSFWARIACVDAGKERGVFFRPEIQDEVIIGFIEGDPRHPVILGMLNSSAKPAPLKAADTNAEKGFVTRTKMKLLFNDEDKSISLQTPAGKQIVLNEKDDKIILSDQHNNKIELSANGILLESAKDISFKTATGTCKIESGNINLKASVKLTAQGNSALDLSSSGQTVVKGAIVNIN